jgi:hypothetical protein
VLDSRAALGIHSGHRGNFCKPIQEGVGCSEARRPCCSTLQMLTFQNAIVTSQPWIRLAGCHARLAWETIFGGTCTQASLELCICRRSCSRTSLKIYAPLLTFATKHGRYLRKMDKRGIGILSFVRASSESVMHRV